MLLNSRNMGLAKDGPSNSVGDVVSNVASAMQVNCPVLPRGDTDMLIKVSFSLLYSDWTNICMFDISFVILRLFG